MKPSDILPVGTMVSGFAKGSLGPFRCDACIHFDDGPPSYCLHPMVQGDLAVEHDDEGRPLVDGDDCCAYQRGKR